MSSSQTPPVAVYTIWGRLLGLRMSDGELLFEHTVMSGSVVLETLIHENRILAACGNKVHCYEYPSGKPIGVAELPGGRVASRVTMLIQDNVCLVGHAGRATCMSLNGEILWHNPLGGKGFHCAGIALPGHARQVDDAD